MQTIGFQLNYVRSQNVLYHMLTFSFGRVGLLCRTIDQSDFVMVPQLFLMWSKTKNRVRKGPQGCVYCGLSCRFASSRMRRVCLYDGKSHPSVFIQRIPFCQRMQTRAS